MAEPKSPQIESETNIFVFEPEKIEQDPNNQTTPNKAEKTTSDSEKMDLGTASPAIYPYEVNNHEFVPPNHDESRNNTVANWDSSRNESVVKQEAEPETSGIIATQEPLLGSSPQSHKDVYDTLTPRQKLLIHCLFMGCSYGYGMLFGSILVIYPTFAQLQGISEKDIQWVFSGNGLGGLVSSFIFNKLVSVAPRRLMFSGSNIVMGLSVYLFAAGPLVYHDKTNEILYLAIMIGSLFLLGCFRIFQYNIMIATTSKMYPKQVTSKISILLGFISIGILTGPIIISEFCKIIDFTFAMMIPATLMILMGFWGFLQMPESYAPKKKRISVFEVLKIRRNFLTNCNVFWVNFINRISITGTSLYFLNVLNIEQTWIPYINDINASAILLMSFANHFFEKHFDHRFIHIFFGLCATGTGAFLVGLPFLPKPSIPLGVFGLFCLQLAMPSISPTSSADMLLVMKEKAGHEVDMSTRDAISSLVNFWSISTWFIGPFFYGSLSPWVSFQTLLAILSVVNFTLAVVYTFGSGLYREGIKSKRKH